jgi:hypothetical protein
MAGGNQMIRDKYTGDLTALKTKELRQILESYGTAHRHTMRKEQLLDAVRRIENNERRFGQPEAPIGFFEDEHGGNDLPVVR